MYRAAVGHLGRAARHRLASVTSRKTERASGADNRGRSRGPPFEDQQRLAPGRQPGCHQGSGLQRSDSSVRLLRGATCLQYRAKLLRQEAFRVKSFSERMRCYQQAEAAIKRCLQLDPTDARAYVGLGRLLCLQRRFDEARSVYEDGVAVTGQHQRSAVVSGMHWHIRTGLI